MIRLYLVDKSHAICQESKKRRENIPVAAYRTLCRWGMGPSDHAIIAQENGKIVGFFRFDLIRGRLYAYGTWVDKKYRGKKLGTKMWIRVLREKLPHLVTVTAISRGGAGLVNSLRRKYHNIHWKFFDYSK